MLKLSLQLVGTVLLVIVRSDLTAIIRNVEGAARKVGLENMTRKHDLKIILDWFTWYVWKQRWCRSPIGLLRH